MLENIIYTLLSNGFHKDTLPILFTTKKLYYDTVLWNKIVNIPIKIKKNFTTLLINYTIVNNYSRVKFLIDSGANVNYKDKYYNIALNYAMRNIEENYHNCSNCRDNIIEALCKKSNLDETMVVFEAILLNNYCALEILCKYDFNIEAKNNLGKTPLALAIELGQPECCYELWKKGADINTTDEWGHTLLMTAVSMNLEYKYVQEIISSHPDKINIKDNEGFSALSHVIRTNDKEIFKLLIKSGADINAINNKKMSILMLTIMNNNIDFVKILCDNKVNIRYEYEPRRNAVGLAMGLKYKDIEKELKFRLTKY
jgi:ankyrin repeat protein